MRRSTERILVSHAGTLPRPPEIVQLMGQGPSGEAELSAKLPAAVVAIVRKQVDAGVDIVKDGEVPSRAPSALGKARLRATSTVAIERIFPDSSARVWAGSDRRAERLAV